MGVGKNWGVELRSWRSRDMEMYPQKRFASGRRRINAAHHVLSHPIWTFFCRVHAILYFCTFWCFRYHVPLRAATYIFVHPYINYAWSREHRNGYWGTKQRRLRHQDHLPNDHLPYWKLNDALEESPTSGRNESSFDQQISTPKTNSLGVEIQFYILIFLISSATMR